jgi:gliding motility-associated lipoprotein GldH
MIKVKQSILIAIVPIITFCYNCSDNYIYQSEIEIPGGKWPSTYAAAFKPEITDTSQSFNINLSVTNSNDYRYNNIWLFIKSVSPEGYSKIDTLEVFIAESDGKWVGEKNNDFYRSKISFKRKVRFPKTGTYTFEIIQGMRDLELKGIYKIGFGLQKIE